MDGWESVFPGCNEGLARVLSWTVAHIHNSHHHSLVHSKEHLQGQSQLPSCSSPTAQNTIPFRTTRFLCSTRPHIALRRMSVSQRRPHLSSEAFVTDKITP
ncbi:hypothetical protein AAFF_G00344420 [Aldrovandia affinis]|uniref:Uncharacterized protein n=1 Tax=Aldrovandia affinis TaxID=143900 RepID=A0AAD7SL73_9TELE|nr:hypothetical protein AAFF_G00344420 [Aldrovandia affinis]